MQCDVCLSVVFLVAFGVKQMDNNCQCYIPFKQQKAATTIFANPFTEIT